MRIIAGEHKGRKLITPPGELIRPTGDKVKAAIFSMVQTHLPGSICCDLFAGTGSLGLEALSRGAAFCTFGDHAQESVDLIRRNVALCGEEERSRIVHGSFAKTLSLLEEPVDLFFLDPPYSGTALEQAVEAIGGGGHLAEGGLIIAEHGKDKSLPESLGGFRKCKEKNYGIVVISIYM